MRIEEGVVEEVLIRDEGVAVQGGFQEVADPLVGAVGVGLGAEDGHLIRLKDFFLVKLEKSKESQYIVI
jgi:hypothetical protein